MAAQTSNHKNKSGNGRSPGASARRQEREAAESSGAYGAVAQMAEQASDYVTHQADYAQDCIREHSGKSVMVSLVAGFGIGLLVGRALATSHREPRSRRYRAAAEGIGRQLMNRIEAMVPDALAEHFGK